MVTLPNEINKYQRPFIEFKDHQFYIHILAEDRLYDAHSFDIIPQANGIDAVAKSLSFGNGSQSDEGTILMKLRMGQHNRDISWMVSATSPRLIKGIKVEITDIPFKSLINPFGQKIYIDDGAVNALKNEKSLLPAGITKVFGEFKKGENILIVDESGRDFARGISSFSSEEIDKVKGLQSNQIENILGYSSKSEIIHKDDMVIL